MRQRRFVSCVPIGAMALMFMLSASTARAAYVGGAVDLTTAGSSATLTAATGGDFIVREISQQPTGTGFINSFLRVQAPKDTAAGYNTSTAVPFQDLAGNFTRIISVFELPIVQLTQGGPSYVELRLDINQTGANPLLSLNQLQIFVVDTDPGNAGVLNTTNLMDLSLGAGITNVFRMSTLANPYDLQLNYDLNPGSGAGDYAFYIPVADFGNLTTNANKKVVLYSQFGNPPGAYGENDGFEEWSMLQGVATCPAGQNCDITPVPEPASLLLLGSGLGLLANRIRSRRKTSKLIA